MTLQGTGEITAGVRLDGILVRDVQLPLGHKYAFLLRPLPARAKRLTAYAARQRRYTLRYVMPTRAQQRCGSFWAL